MRGSAIDLIDRLVLRNGPKHERPAPRPDLVAELIERRLIDRHHGAVARRFARLHAEASILRKSVTAAYEPAGHGTGEMSDRRAEEHAMLTRMYRAAGIIGSRVVELVVIEETLAGVDLLSLRAALEQMEGVG